MNCAPESSAYKTRVIFPDVPDADHANAQLFHFAASGAPVLQEPFVGPRDPFAQSDGVVPAQAVQFGDIEEFARRPVGFGRVPGQVALESDDVTDQFRQFADGDVFAAADIDDFGAVIFLEQEEAGGGQIVDMEKFPARLSRAPDQHLARSFLFWLRAPCAEARAEHGTRANRSCR